MYAPYGKCPRCGWTGKDWGFKYRSLCKRCHSQWRKEKAKENWKHGFPKRNVKVSDGILVSEHVHNRLRRRAERALRLVPAYWLARIVPLTISVTAIYLMRTVGQDTDSGSIVTVIMFGGFFLVILSFIIFQSAWERRVKVKIKELAEVRKQDLDKQQRFYNSPEWKNVRAEVLRENTNICQSCGRKIELANDLTVDHIKPRSKFPKLALDKSNLQVLCRRCNSAKGATYNNQ